ncbi:VWA domain-containing protein [[Mycobacterium] kokjensenii]|uniref:VWA domain-containing protein n=1 Tax=[Mycobacterium] kokjensenii TaxID=3064287 RepID=A0ABM9LFZ2_9MYCO|nr:VWA domain-containing protein [Mycolicibacter sp. MU0083]CAJ1498343.1 VWA domain-containing protein [Mycolicibacter sp. MU0083]
MNTESPEPQRFRLLATHLAGRAVDVALAPDGEPAHTDGAVVFVSASRTVPQQRREVCVQSALLGAGSLDHDVVSRLRGRPSIARRYLALEGARVLADLSPAIPWAAIEMPPRTSSPQQSLELARSRTPVAEPPDWFGVIKPARLSSTAVASGRGATAADLRLHLVAADAADPDEDPDEDGGEGSKLLKLFTAPAFSSRALSDFLRKLMGGSRGSADDTGGGELRAGVARRTDRAGAQARPLATRIEFVDDGRSAATIGVGGALYPEWDVHRRQYRPDWCRVVHFPVDAEPETAAGAGGAVARDDTLRRRLSRVGLGPKVLRRRPDGDDLDIEALTDLVVDLHCGHSPPEHVYLERRRLARNLGVLILVDATGSAIDTDTGGLSVHDHQCRAAATLAATLEELGDRVAVYAFRSHGRGAVHLPAIKTFDEGFGAAGRSRLGRLQPSGYTRLGAAIRGAGDILKAEAGTPNRLLLVLSDGYPYDHGYEGSYARADTRKALEELRSDGMACLCLSIGNDAALDALEPVFGSAGFAAAATLAELSPRMDELFLAALRELAAPKL